MYDDVEMLRSPKLYMQVSLHCTTLSMTRGYRRVPNGSVNRSLGQQLVIRIGSPIL